METARVNPGNAQLNTPLVKFLAPAYFILDMATPINMLRPLALFRTRKCGGSSEPATVSGWPAPVLIRAADSLLPPFLSRKGTRPSPPARTMASGTFVLLTGEVSIPENGLTQP